MARPGFGETTTDLDAALRDSHFVGNWWTVSLDSSAVARGEWLTMAATGYNEVQLATESALTEMGQVIGLALTDSDPGQLVMAAYNGTIRNDISGLTGPGTVRVGANSRCTLSGDGLVVGQANDDGHVMLALGSIEVSDEELTVLGLDGVDAEFDGGANQITVQRSRDVFVVTLSGQQNNFDGSEPARWQECDVLYVSTWSGSRVLTGCVAPIDDGTREKRIINGTSSTITITNNATSTSANRILNPGSVSLLLRPAEELTILYSDVDGRWRSLSRRFVELSGSVMDSGATLEFVGNSASLAAAEQSTGNVFAVASGVPITRTGSASKVVWESLVHKYEGSYPAPDAVVDLVSIGGKDLSRGCIMFESTIMLIQPSGVCYSETCDFVVTTVGSPAANTITVSAAEDAWGRRRQNYSPDGWFHVGTPSDSGTEVTFPFGEDPIPNATTACWYIKARGFGE
jgi:hypothetical protein